MLKLEYLFENYELAKEALAHWEHDSDTLDQMLAKFRISSNAIYPFCQNGAVCFLRLAPVAEKWERNVLGEMEFIQHLLDCGYPALRPIRAKEGEVCLQLDTQWGSFYATAFYKVDGVPIEDTEMSGAVMSAYGKALGKLHCLSAAYTPPNEKMDAPRGLGVDLIGAFGAQCPAPCRRGVFRVERRTGQTAQDP